MFTRKPPYLIMEQPMLLKEFDHTFQPIRITFRVMFDYLSKYFSSKEIFLSLMQLTMKRNKYPLLLAKMLKKMARNKEVF